MVSCIHLLKNEVKHVCFCSGNVSRNTDLTKKQVLVDSSENKLECSSILTISESVEPGVIQQGM